MGASISPIRLSRRTIASTRKKRNSFQGANETVLTHKRFLSLVSFAKRATQYLQGKINTDSRALLQIFSKERKEKKMKFIVTLFGVVCMPLACAGFGVVAPLTARPRTCNHLVREDTISFSEYQQTYVDPILPHAIESSSSTRKKEQMDPDQRAKADEFWLQRFEEDKEKLHRLNVAAGAAATTIADSSSSSSKSEETWAHYKEEYIDPLHDDESTPPTWKGHTMDPEQRKRSDEFWLAEYLLQKEKLHHDEH